MLPRSSAASISRRRGRLMPSIGQWWAEQDPAGAILAQALEQAVDARQLAGAEAASREAGQRWRRGRQTDDGKRPAAAQEGKTGVIRRECLRVGGRVGAPVIPAIARRYLHQRVVVARHQRDPLGRSEAAQPRAGLRELGRQGQIDQIAGDRDVIGRDRMQVAHQGIENGLDVVAPPAQLPREVTEQALVRQLRPGYGRQLAEVQVGDVGEPEHE